jgi:hypothetical protein
MDGFVGPAVRIVLLAGFGWAIVREIRSPGSFERRPWLLRALVVAGLVAYVGLVRVHGSVGRVHIHHWDVYHYYVGAKYYAELGQTRLYEATVVADFEDDRAGFRPRATIRDLSDTEGEVTRRSVVARRGGVKRGFSPQRWRDFKSDIAYFRAVEPERWRSSEIQRDHGYNGTPLTTALLGALARLAGEDPARFLAAVVWADLVLIVLVGVWIARRLGATAGCVFLLCWLLDPLNDYEFTGGAFLRYNYFIALALGIALHREGRPIGTGVCLGLAALFRIFPVFFLLALLACDVISSQRRRRLVEHARVFAAAAATIVVVAAGTSFLATPSDDNPWVEQLQSIGSRNAFHAPNGISLRFPFLYSEAHNVNAAIEAARQGEELDWLAETTRTFERRLPWYAASLAALAGLTLLFARRAVGAEVFAVGLAGLFGVLILSHYYYCMLALVGLMFREDTRVLAGLVAGFAVLSLSSWLPPMSEVVDLRFAVQSVEVGLGLALLLAGWGVAGRRLSAERLPSP